MSSQPELPDPARARDVAQFVASLRELRDQSGLTYRALESRAAEAGAVLPRSTVAETLRHDLLPRPELLDAFVRACGHEEHAASWLEARARLAAGDTDSGEPAPSGPSASGGPRPVPPAPSRSQRLLRGAALTGAIVAVLSAVAGGVTLMGDSSGPSGAPAAGRQEQVPLAAGAYLIRTAGARLCLGESTTHDSGGQVGQFDCSGNVPTYVLEPAGGGEYMIRSLHPVLGHGCLGVDAALLADGARLMNDYCGRRGTAERFRLRPSPEGAGSYLIQPAHTNACVTVPGGIATPGVLARQLPCATPPTGQSFIFEPVPAPTGIPDITTN